MRLFVAIDLDEASRGAVADLQTRLSRSLEDRRKSGLKWVSPQHVHLTLAFLGELTDDRGAAVTEAMRQPIDAEPFELVFGGFGVFPPSGPPRVLWLGVMSGQEEVAAVQRVIAARIAQLGIALEERKFHPHLTLARWRLPRQSDRRQVLAAGAALPVVRLHVSAVSLVESRLSSGGPTYSTLCQARLGLNGLEPLQSR
jgi:2'-5' RNA ligase